MTIVENKYIWYYKKVETTAIKYYNFYFQEGKEMSFASIAEDSYKTEKSVIASRHSRPVGGTAQPQQEFNQQAAQQTFQQGTAQRDIPAGSRSADISAGTAGI